MSKTLAATSNTDLISTSLDADDRKVVRKCIAEIRKTKASIVHDVLKMGEHLFNVRDTLDKYGSKAFAQFLNSDDVQVSRRRAEEYMHAYESFANMPPELTGLFTARALYQLSAPSAPADAPDAAMEKAKGGERITEKVATSLVQELAIEPDPEPEPADPWNEPTADKLNGDEPLEGGSDPAEHAKSPAKMPTRAPIGNGDEPLGAERQDETRVLGEHQTLNEKLDAAGIQHMDIPDKPTGVAEGTCAAVDAMRASGIDAGVDLVYGRIGSAPNQMDGAGHVVTGKVATVFAKVDADWGRMLGYLQDARMVCDALRDTPAGEGLERVGVENDLNRIAQKMEQLRPHSACPRCAGDGCVQCGSRGHVSQTAYMRSYTQSEREALAEKLKPTT